MAQILLAFEDKSFARNMQMRITQKYGLESVIFQDSSQVISMITFLPETQMIVSSESLHEKICNHIAKNPDLSNIKVVVLGQNHSKYSKTTELPANLAFDKLVHNLGFILSLETALMEDAPVAEEKTTVFVMPKLAPNPPPLEVNEEVIPEVDYVAISMKFFSHLKTIKVEFDIFSRIKKGAGFEYILKIGANAIVSDADFDRIKIRGGKELFINKENQAIAQAFFGTHFLNQFQNTQLSINERMILNSESYEILLDVFKDSSFTKYSIEIIKEMIKSINVLLNIPEPFEAFFIGLKEKEISYGYMHSYLACLILLKVMESFSWKSNQSRNKILYLALFHDLCLHNNRLIKIHHSYYKESGKLSDFEKQVLTNHADASAKILDSIVKAPKELTTIVREHHGLKQGVGFLEDLSLGINPLSMAFIVVEEFTTLYLECWEKSNKEIVSEFVKLYPEEIINSLKIKYNKLTYNEVVLVLEKMFKV